MTSFALKLIALAAMLTDHIGDVWSHAIPESFFLRLIGRVAFPLYAFMIAEGCRHTKDMKKYLARLGVFALISEIPFDLCFENAGVNGLRDLTILSFNYQNVFFSLFLSALAIYIFEILREKKLAPLGALAFPAAMCAAELIKSDYGAKAVVMIGLIYLAKNKITRVAAMIIGSAIIYLPSMGYRGALFGHAFSFGLAAFAFACLSCVFVMFYNGRRGPDVKYFFYAAYPAHLLVIAAVQILLKT